MVRSIPISGEVDLKEEAGVRDSAIFLAHHVDDRRQI
jgi:hypothetical protein